MNLEQFSKTYYLRPFDPDTEGAAGRVVILFSALTGMFLIGALLTAYLLPVKAKSVSPLAPVAYTPLSPAIVTPPDVIPLPKPRPKAAPKSRRVELPMNSIDADGEPITCADVRRWANEYGRTKLFAMAVARGMTPGQIRRGRKCLT